MILLGGIKSLNWNMFEYQRLRFKRNTTSSQGGKNCTITYDVPGCLPVEKQVMENEHILRREKAKPQRYIRSPIALSFSIKSKIKTLFTILRNPAGSVWGFFCLCVQAHASELQVMRSHLLTVD